MDYGDTPGGGLWRAEIGQQWHQRLRQNAEKENAGWSFEVPCNGSIAHSGWTFEITGRIDQFLAGPMARVREIKTIHWKLPDEPAVLRQRFKTHLLQLLIYQQLLLLNGNDSQGELLLIDISTGEVQSVPTEEIDADILESHLHSIAQHLEERRSHAYKLRRLRITPPFDEPRDGQNAAAEELLRATKKHSISFFEAPTGFGKTGLAIHRALQELAGGTVDRLLLLTGKNTGQRAYLKQINAYREQFPEIGVHVLRSRKDLALQGVDETLSRQEILQNWTASGLSATELLQGGPLSVEDLKRMGLNHQIPPTAINRLLLPYADVWIADFNYLFDPVVAPVVSGIISYNPARTFLVIDEAHNLSDRVAASFSHTYRSTELDAVLTELQFSRFPGKLTRLVDSLLSLVSKLKPSHEMEPFTEADVISLIREICDCLKDRPYELDELSEPALDWLWSCTHAIEAWDHPQLSHVFTIPLKGSLTLSCLNAAPLIGEILNAFSKVILMSATLQPWKVFHAEMGLGQTQSTGRIIGQSSWLNTAFSVAVDARVDTRYRARPASREKTAHTIGRSAIQLQEPLAAFFPSYRYAESVLERLAFLYPQLRVELQPRDLPLEEQEAFLQLALQQSDILFLVVGGRFTEGIDALGGAIQNAIVVGPALPEFNSLQQAKESLYRNRAEAFQNIYLVPGMRKIRQALGRLVRSPEHRARVLLQCDRFASESFLVHLPEHLQPTVVIRSDEDLQIHWLDALSTAL
jgi:Rad3-related DNA helicase